MPIEIPRSSSTRIAHPWTSKRLNCESAHDELARALAQNINLEDAGRAWAKISACPSRQQMARPMVAKKPVRSPSRAKSRKAKRDKGIRKAVTVQLPLFA